MLLPLNIFLLQKFHLQLVNFMSSLWTANYNRSFTDGRHISTV